MRSLAPPLVPAQALPQELAHQHQHCQSLQSQSQSHQSQSLQSQSRQALNSSLRRRGQRVPLKSSLHHRGP